MSLLIVRPEAEQELQEAYDWYERKQPTLGDQFLGCVQEAIDAIKIDPKMYAFVIKDLRRMKVRRFPYGVYYRIEGDNIQLVAVFHGSRNLKTLKERD